MSLDDIPFEILKSSLEYEHYILLFDVSKHYRKLVCVNVTNDEEYLYTAVMLGNLNFISWWKYKQYPTDTCFYINVAAHYGHLDIMKWWHINISPYDHHNHDVCCDTGNNPKYIEILEWLFQLNPEYITNDDLICQNAIEIDNLPALIWLYDHGAEINEGCYNDAILGNNLEIIKYLHSKGNVLTNLHYKYALQHGDPNISEFIFHNMETDPEDFD